MTYFNAPPRVQTSVFTRLPDAFRHPRRNAWADTNRRGLACDSFLEGPSFDRQGRLYVVDIPFGRIFRISPAGDWTQIAEYDGWPNGLKIHQDGRIFIADYKNGLMLLDPERGTVETVLGSAHSEGFKGLNDLVFGHDGTLYFTDQGQTGMHDPTGRVYRLLPSGRLECLVATCPSPNGLALSPEEDVLYVAMTRANQIWRVPLHENGWISKVGVFANLHGGPSGPDGLAVDAEGGLFICHTGIGIVWRLSPRAEPLLRIDSCVAGLSTTNLAFGGKNGRQLFITESATGSILRADVPVAGLPLYSASLATERGGQEEERG